MPKKLIKIKRWLRDGNDGLGGEDQDIYDSDSLLDAAGRALDKAYSHDIVGECVFEGEDGKFYVGCVEFVISEANPDYVRELLVEIAEEQDES